MSKQSGYLPRSFGSSTSRRESPRTFMAKTTNVSAIPGNMAIQGAEAKYVALSPLSIDPQEITLVGVPTPRKLSEASITMTLPKEAEEMTKKGPKVLGRIWRNMIRAFEEPNALAAST